MELIIVAILGGSDILSEDEHESFGEGSGYGAGASDLGVDDLSHDDGFDWDDYDGEEGYGDGCGYGDGDDGLGAPHAATLDILGWFGRGDCSGAGSGDGCGWGNLHMHKKIAIRWMGPGR